MELFTNISIVIGVIAFCSIVLFIYLAILATIIVKIVGEKHPLIALAISCGYLYGYWQYLSPIYEVFVSDWEIYRLGFLVVGAPITIFIGFTLVAIPFKIRSRNN